MHKNLLNFLSETNKLLSYIMQKILVYIIIFLQFEALFMPLTCLEINESKISMKNFFKN